MSITFRLASLKDLPALIEIGDQLFDFPIKEERAREFLADPRHHLMLAFDGREVVGMASGLHYVHPDKDPQLFIDEVGVVSTKQNMGIGRRLVRELVAHGKKKLNCTEAWVLAMDSNKPAQRTYQAAGGKKEEEPVVMFEF